MAAMAHGAQWMVDSIDTPGVRAVAMRPITIGMVRVWQHHGTCYSINISQFGDGRQRDRGEAMHERQPTRRRPVLYLVYATPLDGGPTVEDTVAASDEDNAYEKARTLYPRDRYDVTVYLQSADDD